MNQIPNINSQFQYSKIMWYGAEELTVNNFHKIDSIFFFLNMLLKGQADRRNTSALMDAWSTSSDTYQIGKLLERDFPINKYHLFSRGRY